MSDSDARNLLDQTVAQLHPRYVIALFSGGGDSTVSTHLAAQHPDFSFALKIDTGIGVEQTNQYVRDMCATWGVELREYAAVNYTRADGTPDPQVYRELVLRWGFPGPAGHNLMFQRLKERALRQCLRDLNMKRGEVALLVSGCRAAESVRRMANTEPLQHWEGRKWFVAPIWKFSAQDTRQYMRDHNITPNPVAALIHKSGECLCGAFAKSGELAELEVWFPNVASEIRAIEAEARAAGFPWGWEDSPPKWFTRHRNGQAFLPGMIPEGVLCSSCVQSDASPPPPNSNAGAE